MSNIHFSIVILCYKGGESIVPFIEKVHKMLSAFKFQWEMILVANYFENTGDKTPEVAHEISNRLPFVKVIAKPKQGMMGWDMRSGMDSAQGDYIAVIDGDGQFPLESTVSCLTKMEIENLDLVKTYRVQRDDGLYRRLISFVYNWVFKLFFGSGLHDVNSKPKIIKREKYNELKLTADDWFIDAEIMIKAKRMGFIIGELPVHFFAHSTRASFVKPQAILEFVKNLLRYRFSK